MNKSELSRDERVFGIVIPFYREIDYLLELVESLKNQTDPRFEVLIIDDSSRMLISPEWITQKLDNRFSVKTNEINLGPFQTWNLGLSEMMNRQKYSLVSIVHEDDVLHPNYVKNSLACLVKHPEIDIFHSKVKVIGPRGKRKFSFQDMFKRIGYRGLSYKPVLAVSDQGLARILNNNYLFCPTMVFNSVKFTKIEFEVRWKMVGDLDFVSKALLDGRSILQLPDKNYFYRRHQNNLTAELTRTAKRFEEEIELYGGLESRCREVGFYKSAAVAKKARIIKLHIVYRITISLLRFDIAGLKHLFNVLLTIGK